MDKSDNLEERITIRFAKKTVEDLEKIVAILNKDSLLKIKPSSLIRELTIDFIRTFNNDRA